MSLYAVLNYKDTPHLFHVKRLKDKTYVAYGDSLCGAVSLEKETPVKEIYDNLRVAGNLIQFSTEDFVFLPKNLCQRCGVIK